MNDYIINYKHGSLDQLPIEIEVIVWNARTPSISEIGDHNVAKFNAQITGVTLHPRCNLFFCFLPVPSFEQLGRTVNRCSGDDKFPNKSNRLIAKKYRKISLLTLSMMAKSLQFLTG